MTEEEIRQHLGEALDAKRRRAGYPLRTLAQKIGTSLSQVQRLLHMQEGGTLTLTSIVRAADAFGCDVQITLVERKKS